MARRHVAGVAAVLALGAGFTATPLIAQRPDQEQAVLYEREIFVYPGSNRVDPFRSLLKEGDLGVRLNNLMLRGIVHHSDPAQSVAVLTESGTDRRIQAKIGERVGSLRVVAIYQDRVDVVVEELGVARRETLRMEGSPSQESNR